MSTQYEPNKRGQADHIDYSEDKVPDEAKQGTEDYLEDPKPKISILDTVLNVLQPKVKPGATFPTNDPEATAEAVAVSMAAAIKDLFADALLVKVAPSDQLVCLHTYADPTGRELVGVQADRLRIEISNLDNANDIFISNNLNTATVDTGVKIAAGTSKKLETKAAIYVVSEVAQVNVDVILEMQAIVAPNAN